MKDRVVTALLLLLLTMSQGALGAQPAKTRIRFRMWNSSEHVVQEVYVSPASDSKWGRNLLSQPVKPGQKFTMTIEGGCGAYDVRFVAPDGIEYMREGLNFCEDDEVVRLGKRAVKKHTAAEALALEQEGK